MGKGVKIGRNCKIDSGARIYDYCVIGDNCIVHSNTVIGGDGFGFQPTAEGFKKIPQLGNVIIEDDVEIGSNCSIDRATIGSTIIGKGTKIDNLIQIAHNVKIEQGNLKKGLSNRHIQLIALGGSIGTGLLTYAVQLFCKLVVLLFRENGCSVICQWPMANG